MLEQEARVVLLGDSTGDGQPADDGRWLPVAQQPVQQRDLLLCGELRPRLTHLEGILERGNARRESRIPQAQRLGRRGDQLQRVGALPDTLDFLVVEGQQPLLHRAHLGDIREVPSVRPSNGES